MSKDRLSISSRRDLLRGLVLMGGTGLVTLSCCRVSQIAFAGSANGDLSILLAALYLEHEAIAAYQAGAESGLLPENLLQVAVAFQKDHKYHRDVIVDTIKSLGGTPIEAMESYSFGKIKSVKDILKLAYKLEQGAVDAYSSLASNIQNRAVLDFAAHVLVDEVRHTTVLSAVSV